ncbi:Na+/H+ antiporter subunit E [Metarhizobium album]|uniref:Na+/H+ antiporter subunit E n=1 Tax=Metarhizobium album TaxID=2182425 RepID=A0A2U2DXV7_9HYPH|nr:Na+/H+ antiporter subunit E [Rhizobium album]PWE58153.1 Na+/H+ antiporter subunit E [Rhizobium album]
MRRLAASLILAVVWAVVTGSAAPANLLLGLLLAILCLGVTRRHRGRGTIAVRPVALLLLGLVFLRELALSAWSVAIAVLRPRLDIRPAMVAFPLRLKRDFEIALLANCITLTPGTLSVDVSEDRRFLHVHALDCRDPQDLCRGIAETFERRIMEAFP